MAGGLPRGWDLDYDGTRWFYTYKATGHIQYHFPSEGDEFPDFVDAASPAPQLAPEERLESQQQVRRRTSHHQGHLEPDPDRWKSRMTATARPVSSVWEGEERQGREEEAFQPESFMFLGPGTYVDISPLVEEEEDAARRAVAGGSPSVSGGALTPMGAGGKPEVSPQAQDAVPADAETPGMEEGDAVVVHMLDGREMPHELPVEERFNPVGVMAEMATGETGRARAETHPDPVEIGDNAVLAPVETTFREGMVELPEKSSPVEKRKDEGDKGVALTEVEKPVEQQQEPRQQQQQQQQDTEQATQFKITRKPTNAGAKYQVYEGGRTPMEQPSAETAKRESWQPPPRRNSSLMMGNGGSDTELNTSSVPETLSLQQGVPEKQPDRTSAEESDSEQPSTLEQVAALQHVSSVLNPTKSQSADSVQESPQASPPPPIIEVPPESSNDEATEDQGQSGISKAPSVLKPARGRAPSQPTNPNTPSSNEPLPRKSYLQATDGQNELSTQTPNSHQGNYVPYTGQRRNNPNTLHPVRVGPEQPDRPASAMPVVESHSQPVSGALPPQQDQYHGQRDSMPPQAQILRPASTPAVAHVHQLQPSAIIAQDSPAGHVMSQGPPETTTMAPSPPSPGKIPPVSPPQVSDSSSPAKDTQPASPAEVSPVHSRSASLSSGAPAQTPSPADYMRRGSSAVSLAQVTDGTATFTPSPESQTPPSGAQSVVSPPAKPSGLRHSISGTVSDQPTETVANLGPPVPRKIPLEQEQDSYFPAQDRGTPSPARRHSLPAEQTSTNTQSSGPVPPPKIPEQPPREFTRSQTTPESLTPQTTAPPQQQDPSPPAQAPINPGHVLHPIEEHDEEPPVNEAPKVEAPEPSSLSKRHSLASSIQQSPNLGRQSPASASVASSASISAGVAVAQQAQRPTSQVQLVNVQSPGTGPRSAQQHPPPQGQVPPQDQSQAYPAPHVPPGQQPEPRFPQQPWNPQMGPNMTPVFRPGSVPPQNTASPAPKDKEKKWTKWFRGSKTPKPTQAAQPQHAVPAPGQIPPPGLQMAPYGWAPGPYGQPVVWQPGQQPQGHPQPGSHQQQLTPQFAQWQPIYGAQPPGPYPQPTGPPPSLYRPDTGSSASTNGSSQPNRPSMESQRVQQPGIPGQPPVGPVQQPAPFTQQPQGVPQAAPAQPVMRQGSIAGSHSPSGQPVQNETPTMAGGSRRASTTSLPQQSNNPPASAQVDATLMPQPLFSNANVPPLGQSSGPTAPQSAPAPQGNKWGKRPVADYSGGGWGDEDAWARR